MRRSARRSGDAWQMKESEWHYFASAVTDNGFLNHGSFQTRKISANRKGDDMGVRTAANEKITEAFDGVDMALKSLTEIVVNKCWGYDEFATEKNKKLEALHAKLLVIRREIEEQMQ